MIISNKFFNFFFNFLLNYKKTFFIFILINYIYKFQKKIKKFNFLILKSIASSVSTFKHIFLIKFYYSIIRLSLRLTSSLLFLYLPSISVANLKNFKFKNKFNGGYYKFI